MEQKRIDLDDLEAALEKYWPYCPLDIKVPLPALLAEVRELRAQAARSRWCEEKKAEVSWSDTSRRWRVSWVAGGMFDIATDADRSAAIDAARKVK